jgi:hypothetical protein
MEDVRFAER